jgi:signal transduction histidine kinase
LVLRTSQVPVIRTDDVSRDGNAYGRAVATLTAHSRAVGAVESPRVQDAVLAVLLAVVAVLDLRFDLDNSTRYGSSFAVAVVVATVTLVLAWRRERPLGVLGVVCLAIAGPELFGTLTFTLWGHFVPLLVAAYSVARWGGDRPALVGVVLVAATIAVVMLRVPSAGSLGNIPFAAVPTAAVMATGRVLRRRHEHTRELADRAKRLETEHEADVAEALADERSRIARELHDVVAHCVSVMVVQAGASEALLTASPPSPGEAVESLRQVQRTGQDAITELTRVLGLLRGGPGGSSYDLLPQPGADQLPDLVERLRASGLDVTFGSSGEPRPLPPGVDLTVFRIAQEALTNTLKHAGGGARTCVELRYRSKDLELEVRDDGSAALGGARRGHGLIGMAERVSLFGGTLDTGACPDGGFRVLVSLPVEYR